MDSRELFKKFIPSLILASQSLGRKELLEELGCQVTVQATYIDESHALTKGSEIVSLLALRKQEGYFAQYGRPTLPLLTADTLVVLEGKIIGKARFSGEAEEFLSLLSGKTHTVYSAFCLYLPAYELYLAGSDVAKVTFKALTKHQIGAYLRGEEWQGAAGAYRVQGQASAFIAAIDGDVSTVVGLPIEAISAIFRRLSL
ncbi:MAG: Maf family protein [Sphaerochaetaceae bacterium]